MQSLAKARKFSSGQVARRLIVLALCANLLGCHGIAARNKVLEESLTPADGVPRELAKSTLPTYRIEPPDVLFLDAVKIVPKEPYEIEPLDLLTIVVEGTPPESPIQGEFRVDASGNVVLGPGYGRVRVTGLSIQQAQDAIHKHLSKILAAAEVAVSLAEPAARQAITGDHLVGQDGTINLGIYGNVRVVGMTLDQAREAIEEHLSEFLKDPQIGVEISSFSSKVYYVILQGAGEGDQVTRIPITGNETVIDALAELGGLTANQSKHMWIARPSPDGLGYDQILPINWNAISQSGCTTTNYQILPGDRLFISEDKFVALSSFVTKVTAPFERFFGFTLLGTQTVQTIIRSPTGFRGISGATGS